MIETIFSRLHEIYPEMVHFRRDLHMYPEISFQEVNTPKKIADYLKGLGVEVKTGVGGRGVLGILKGGKPGKTVALRADFDALPIQDEKEVDYKSRIPGVMHACGHDLHTAALLGVATVLSEVKDDISGTIVFLHQFAEELTPGGAKPMIEDGCLDGVDVIYGAHVMSTMPVGEIGVGEGYMSTAADEFEIEIFGKGGHGSQPHLTVDPLVLGCQVVLNLQQIVSRRIDPLKSAVVTVGSIHSGQAPNVIPDSVKITGTVRTFEEDVRDLIEETIGQMVKSTCDSAGATFEYKYLRDAPSMYNDATETNRVEAMAKLVFDEEQVKRVPPMMGSEDFSYYQKEVPGMYFFVGGGNPAIKATYPHHHPKFDVDESAMLTIGKVFIATVLNYLSDGVIKPSFK
ncbi:M20 metallopeptidase family protein [Bacillus massiliigorillae]|uniref:M20 metallopeptidase family protein n=1 Tax=Bacillus massiliigorillae TaxID=1243664 RepID=UPI0003A88075|nr:M20 family metallopeptidase [Bacillus massiliigorillae]